MSVSIQLEHLLNVSLQAVGAAMVFNVTHDYSNGKETGNVFTGF